MAAIRCKHETLVVLGVNSLIIYSDGKETELTLPEKCQVEEEAEQKKQRKDVAKTDNSEGILAAAFSSSGKYFAVGDNAKQLHLYEVNPDWKLVSTRSLSRRCTALAFTYSEAELVVADRTGDVYRFPVLQDPQGAGNLLMGHLSMVLDITMTRDDQYIITCDRDEKVRISHFPNAYNIHSYCLLHSEYVSQLVYIDSLHCLLSGSGDGRIAVWDLSGSCHDSVLEEEQPPQAGDQPGSEGQTIAQGEPLPVKRLVYDDHCSVVAAIFFRSKRLQFYSLQSADDKIRLKQEQEVELAGEPWDMEFDAQHRLWLLQACESDCVVVYTCHRAGHQLKVNRSQGMEAVDCVTAKLNARWDHLKSTVDWRTEFINLSKAKSYDNVQKYLEKKEQRMKGIKPEEPPEKKVKSSG